MRFPILYKCLNLKRSKLKLSGLLVLWLLLFCSVSGIIAQTNETVKPEPFNLSVKFENVGWSEFYALYAEPNQLYLPLSRVFDVLKINATQTNNGKTIEGYFIDKNKSYKVDYDAGELTFGSLKIPLTPENSLYDMGVLYLSPTVLNQAFGLKTNFDFRSLSANISADYELPVMRLMKLEDARRLMRGYAGDEKYDKEYPRKYHFLKTGMLDWSVSANQSAVYGNETRAGLALGAEVFGGELSTWLYYSDKFGFNRNQQRYHWRWVDNNFKLIRQFQVGRIYNRNIATLLYPVDGFMVTNAPTTIRKALGTYQISENTNPDWLVELYINNVLMDYTRADASGFFSFQVPIVYGSTEVTLRYYGPNGEEHADRKTYNMPYNMLPVGEFEYRVSGGTLLDGFNTLYGRAETNLGIAKWLTAGAGYEYLASIAGNPHIPFGNLTLQPFSKMIITGEYAHKVRYKASLNYNFANNSMLELFYARYDKNQKAIIYNFLEERIGSFSFPVRFKNVSTVTKASFRQNIYPNFQYNSGELMFSTFYRNFNANLSNYLNYTTFDNRNIYSNLSLGFRFNKGFSFRPSVMYSFTENNPLWYQNIISYKAELEKQIFKKGYLTVGYENNNLVDFSSVHMAFRYDFSFLSTYASAHYTNGAFQTAQSARGSLAFGGGNGYVHFDAREAVGRSAIAIVPYVDINFNGKRDVNEPAASGLDVACSGGKTLQRKNDSIVRVVGLDPFVDYSLSVTESNFNNIAWKINTQRLKITTDPNQFKQIEIPVQPMGEMSGLVVDEYNNGVSRILINIFNTQGKSEKTVMTENDGFYSYLGLKPGNYVAVVDSMQLKVLNMTAEPVSFKIKEDVNGDIVEVLPLKLIRNIIPNQSREDSLNAVYALRNAASAEAMSKLRTQQDSINLLNKMNPYTDKNTTDPDRITKFDSILQYIILFDFNSSVVRSKFYGTIKQLGRMLRENESLKLEIQGHTDAAGDENVNLIFSERRANSVKRMLVKYGISEDRLRIVGFGEKQPMPGNTNRTKAQRAQNRRVVFKAISDKDMARIDSIQRKSPESLTARDIRTLKKSMKYVDEFDPFEVKWRYMYSLFFRYGNARIRTDQQMIVNAVAGVMQKNACLNVLLESHTDPESNETFNMNLSMKRSQAVWDALVYRGVDRTRIEVANYGEYQPPYSNANETEKELNRRVSIKVAPSGCQLPLDSLITQEIIKTYRTRISNQIIINHDGRYMIQTGAFKTEQLALMMALKLKDLLPDNIYIVPENGLFRVIVGYTKTRKEATDIARVIQASGIIANPLQN
jgi:outer membrane protein OmpA-like peptidoglycan-associated protein